MTNGAEDGASGLTGVENELVTGPMAGSGEGLVPGVVSGTPMPIGAGSGAGAGASGVGSGGVGGVGGTPKAGGWTSENGRGVGGCEPMGSGGVGGVAGDPDDCGSIISGGMAVFRLYNIACIIEKG